MKEGTLVIQIEIEPEVLKMPKFVVRRLVLIQAKRLFESAWKLRKS